MTITEIKSAELLDCNVEVLCEPTRLDCESGNRGGLATRICTVCSPNGRRFLDLKINQNVSSARSAKKKPLLLQFTDLSSLTHFSFFIITTGSEPDIWPFDNLDNIEVYGNARHEQSPLGKGLYLDGTTGTYVKLKGYDENCLEHPSNCDIAIGFFLKLMPKSGWQIFFGNKDANETLYEGVNIYFKDGFRVMVYGKDKYCSRVISPPLGVWFYIGLVWERVGKLTVYVDSSSSQIPPYYCGKSPNGLKTSGDYYLGRDTYPVAYYKDLNIWYSKQLTSVFDRKLNPAFGEFYIGGFK